MEKYFKNMSYYYAYAILELDGQDRTEALSIFDGLYYDKAMAKTWLELTIEKLKDIQEQELKEEAINEIKKIYNKMIK